MLLHSLEQPDCAADVHLDAGIVGPIRRPWHDGGQMNDGVRGRELQGGPISAPFDKSPGTSTTPLNPDGVLEKFQTDAPRSQASRPARLPSSRWRR